MFFLMPFKMMLRNVKSILELFNPFKIKPFKTRLPSIKSIANLVTTFKIHV